MRFYLFLISVLLSFLPIKAQITLQKCQELARENYPVLKKFGLVEKTLEINLSEINKSWLPSINLYVQGSIQNVTPAFPEVLENLLEQMGQNFKGLGKLQYKVGIDVNQSIWDGGTSKARRELARNQEEVSKASLEVELYSLNQKVNDIYFAILLIEEQIEQSLQTKELLSSNHSLLSSMFKNGTAMRSDVDMVEAQLLTLKQTITQAQYAAKGYRNVLSVYVGEDISNEKLIVPQVSIPAEMFSHRPELDLLDKRIKANESSRLLIQSSLMPKIGLFAQAFYGYPGFDNFKSMRSRDLSFNILGGLRLSWDVGALYNKKNRLSQIDIDLGNIEIDRETFLFNSNLQTERELEVIKGYKNVMDDDQEIIRLRQNVRIAAESQLKNGIIDATALLAKITDENNARLNAEYHKIEYIQEIYKLKNTLNQ